MQWKTLNSWLSPSTASSKCLTEVARGQVRHKTNRIEPHHAVRSNFVDLYVTFCPPMNCIGYCMQNNSRKTFEQENNSPERSPFIIILFIRNWGMRKCLIPPLYIQVVHLVKTTLQNQIDQLYKILKRF